MNALLERFPFPMCSPLIEWERPSRERLFCELSEAGIRRPRLYEAGFPHNNCGGFCVKAGITQFVALYHWDRDRYLHHEEREQSMRDYLGKDVSILRDRRGGEKKTLTLRSLRERIESGEKFPTLEWGGCGCAIDD